MLNKLFSSKKKENKKKRDVSLDDLRENFTVVTKGKNLPPRFAEQLLFLEMEMESEIVDLISVTKLLELYANAIEYYESIKSDKYFIFKNKTQSLLLRPNVSAAMLLEQMKQQKQSIQKEIPFTKQTQVNTPVSVPPPKVDKEKVSKVVLEKSNHLMPAIQQLQKEHNLMVQYINAQDSQENAKIMLNQHKQEQNQTKNIISGEIKHQTNDVLKRLEQRKKSKLDKRVMSLSSFPLDESFEERKKEYQDDTLEAENSLKQMSDISGQLNVPSELKMKISEPPSQTLSSSGTKKKEVISLSRKNGNEPLLFFTPEKENQQNKSNCNLNLNKIITSGFNHINNSIGKNNSYNKMNTFNHSGYGYNQRESSPILIKLNSYGKEDSLFVNPKWMTASINNYHTPFQFN